MSCNTYPYIQPNEKAKRLRQRRSPDLDCLSSSSSLNLNAIYCLFWLQVSLLDQDKRQSLCSSYNLQGGSLKELVYKSISLLKQKSSVSATSVSKNRAPTCQRLLLVEVKGNAGQQCSLHLHKLHPPRLRLIFTTNQSARVQTFTYEKFYNILDKMTIWDDPLFLVKTYLKKSDFIFLSLTKTRGRVFRSRLSSPPYESAMATENLYTLLERAARRFPEKGILYLEGDDIISGRIRERRQTYAELLKEARTKSFRIRMRLMNLSQKENGCPNKIVVLHLDGYYESLVWFWAVVAAGAIPVMSLPLKGTPDDHARYVNHIRDLFEEPLIITNSHLAPLFAQFKETTINLFRTSEVELYETRDPQNDFCFPGSNRELYDIACIMLTSGSTGKSKAVSIKHGMILRSIEGKSAMHITDRNDTFLSWTETSHVANLIEIHLHALALGADQIQIESHRVISNPVLLIELINKYRVSYTFAPNFFLASLVKALDESKQVKIVDDHVQRLEKLSTKEMRHYLKHKTEEQVRDDYAAPFSRHRGLTVVGEELTKAWDLGCLRAVISGGESNVVETCYKLTEMLQEFNAPCSFVKPGFGMTETCAGCIYSIFCPSLDRAQKLEFASVGAPIQNAKMRITIDGEPARHGRIGRLELNGLVVFDRYYRDPYSTAEAFTKDGWFITGDNARIDSNGRLHIIGRQKDVMCINGVNHHPFVVEAALERAAIPGMKSSWTVIFSYRPSVDGVIVGTECMCVVYVPTYNHFDVESRIKTLTAISSTVVLMTGSRPYRVVPVPERVLSKSVLGKLSRSEIRAMFESERFLQFEDEDDRLIYSHQKKGAQPSTDTERIIIQSLEETFSTGVSDLSAAANLFNLGVSSSDLLKLRVRLQANLHIERFPLTYFFAHPTVRELGTAIDNLEKTKQYEPVVTLRPKTAEANKTPLFFIHPGMGEVLIFMNLARHINDRPVYAIRARGFDGEEFFGSMEEIVDSYLDGIKRHQPSGPYALAGYSFGSMLGFEIAKRLIAEGQEVRFLATLDQAPFFKERARSYDWYECVLSVSFFLGLMDESLAYAEMNNFRRLTRGQVLAQILDSAPPLRIQELGMDATRLERWADLAMEMKRITWNYDPEGQVPHMDIFYTVPLIGIVKARTTEEWRNDFIGKWDRLVERPEYHFVEGGHRTMINPPYLATFQATFRAAMDRSGI